MIELKQQEIRKQLLACLQAGAPKITAAAEKFYNQVTRSETNCLQALEDMITAFDGIINAGDWESSLFLSNIIKPLRTMHQQAVELREQLTGGASQLAVAPPQLAAGMVSVYIALFQQGGNRLSHWEQLLKVLPQYILGRPIYRYESEVQQAIRSKLVQVSDAYVCVGVPEVAIQKGEYHPLRVDRQGNTLLQLAHGSVQSENILEFIYQNKSYYFIGNKLIEK